MGMSSTATLDRRPATRPAPPTAPGSLPANLAGAVSGEPLWRAWPGREWPASSDEERALLADLRDRSKDPRDCTEPRRGDITALLNALRCGLDAADLLGRAPGLRPSRLVAAHADLERRRREAVSAWHVIASAASAESVVRWGDAAAALVPVVIDRLRSVGDGDELELSSLVATYAADIERIGRLAASVELVMSDPGVPARRRVELGALLFGSTGSGLWQHECYLADRVGALVPVRVAALLGEQAAR
ncbi:MAG: hypothetical protein ACRDZZ_13485 [Ilumatobacteraceae bacterium]